MMCPKINKALIDIWDELPKERKEQLERESKEQKDEAIKFLLKTKREIALRMIDIIEYKKK